MGKHHRRQRNRHRLRRRSRPGQSPGVIVVNESAPPSSFTLISYGPDDLEMIEQASIAQALALRGKREVLWMHIEGLGSGELIRDLGEAFSLHALALEDSVTPHQAVKVEDYGDYLFLVSRMIAKEAEQGTTQLSVFLSNHVVITIHEHPSELMALLRPRLDNPSSQLRQKGADFLAYAILDAVLDQYFPLLEQFGDRLDDLEDRITDHPPRELMHQVHELRVELRLVRRTIWQQREAVNVLLRDPTPLIKAETKTYLRDCHDHTIQLVELLEVDHEMCADLRDVYLSSVSNRMNEIMMVLTVIATIFIPLSFIASLYGMNFRPEASPLNMPEVNWYYGYPFALALMLGTVMAMLIFFWHRGWIWRTRELADPPQSDSKASSD